jgi:PAS domain S-box-containing protein
MSDTEQLSSEISLIRQILTDRSVPSLESDNPLIEAADVKQTFDDLVAIREILKQFSGGNFDLPITVRGVFAGYLKTLQANLRHLSWQVEQVADGDLSQRVYFMGSFSKAFNMLTERLESSLQKLKEQEANRRSSMLFDLITTSCFFFDENLSLIDINLAAAKLFGFETKEHFFESISDISSLSPEYQPNGKLSSEESQNKLRETLKKGKTVFLWTYQRLDGKTIPVEITLNRIDWDGKAGIVGSIQDLRKLLKTRKMLKRQQREFRHILNSSPVCLTILTGSGVVRYATPFMQDFLGIGLREKLQDYFCDKFLADYLLLEAKEHPIQWRQVSLKTKQGEHKEMLVNMFLMNYFDERSIITWFVDITKIREYETELITSRNAAENLAKVKGEFLSNMSHEIKTPMNAIIGMLHLVKSTNLTGQQVDFVHVIEQSSKHLLRIINNILDFSEIENNKLILENEQFPLDELLNSIEQEIRYRCIEQKLTFSIQRESVLPSHLIGDAARLRQVLEHLLDNAVKFTPSGSICLKIKSVMLETPQVELFFTVSDTGIGLNEKDLQNIFTPFLQADGSRTRKVGGAGLGLSICQELVNKMGGTIWAESNQESRGAKFTFTARFDIPAVQQEQPAITAEPAEEEKSEDETASRIIMPNRLQGASILLADDNRVNQIVAAELLKKKGFQVDIASNGRQAVEKVKQNKYALVLMDIQMPEMDGIEAVQIIRKLPDVKDLPIVALTANDSEDDRKEYYAAGMNGVLGKPINPLLLYNTIIRWATPQNV